MYALPTRPPRNTGPIGLRDFGPTGGIGRENGILPDTPCCGGSACPSRRSFPWLTRVLITPACTLNPPDSALQGLFFCGQTTASRPRAEH